MPESRHPTDATFFHPSRRAYRYMLLLFVSLLTFGSYFAYDSIGAIAPQLIDALGIGRETIGHLYAAYSVAAIIIVFVGGLLTDKLGTRKASLIFSGLVTLGAAVVAIAPNVPTLYLGRFIFGAGSESLVVAQSAILARWFSGKELALSFGVTLTVSRLGTLFSFNIESLVARHFGNYKFAFYAAVLFCVVSLLSNLVYNLMDRRAETALKLPTEGAGDKIVLSDVKYFNSSYWFVTLLCVTFYSAIFPFTDLATDMFHDKWGYPTEIAGTGSFLSQVFGNFFHMFSTAPGMTSIVIFASMVCAPFAGAAVDRFGKRASLMILGSLILVPSHLIMGVSKVTPIYPMLALGAAFVLVPAAMWPSIPLLVEKNRVGTAFGLTTAIQNVGLGLFPILSGWLRDETHDYVASEYMFSALGLAGLLFAFFLLRADRKASGVLERGRARPATQG